MDIADASETTVHERLWPNEENSGICKPLFECFQNGLFCDVVLIADDGKKIPAHRLVLYSASIYFKTMFTTELRERSQSEVRIQWIPGEILQKLVEYCYGEEIVIDSGNVEELARASTMLQFTRVQDKCFQMLSASLSPTNCLGIREFAEQHNMVCLAEEARHMVLDRFVEASRSEEFLQLDVNQLAELLKHDQLNVAEEEEVFNALLGWVKYDVDGRRQSFSSLLEFIRFQLVKDSFMYDEVNEQCIELNRPEIFSSIVKRRSSKLQRESPRLSRFKITLAYGAADSRVTIDRYLPCQNVWTNVKSLDIKCNYFAVVHREGKLILIGGSDATSPIINKVKSVDVETGEVINLPPMISARLLPSAVLLNDFIYVFIGLSEPGWINRTVERFDFATSKWTEVTPMSIPRRFSAHVVLLDCLYVFGGRNGEGNTINSVEYYDPMINKWVTVAPMRHNRYGHAACTSGGLIYVFGGCDAAGHLLQSIERYHPRENTWTDLTFSLHVPRYRYCCAVAEGDWAYLAGGYNSLLHPMNDFFKKVNLLTGEVIKLKELRRPCSDYPLLKY